MEPVVGVTKAGEGKGMEKSKLGCGIGEGLEVGVSPMMRQLTLDER